MDTKAQVSGFLVAALVLELSVAHAQVGSIAGRVTREESELPFSGVLVAVDAPQYYGRHPTVLGIYLLTKVPVGTWNVEFHCPSASYIGREIQTRSVTVEFAQLSIVDVVVPEGHCYEPPYSEVESDFSGYMAFGFEHSEFLPCDEGALNLSKNTFSERNRIWVNNPRWQGLSAETWYYVEFSGILKGPGSFGHLGGSEYEIQIANLDEAREVDEPNCPRD